MLGLRAIVRVPPLVIREIPIQSSCALFDDWNIGYGATPDSLQVIQDEAEAGEQDKRDQGCEQDAERE